MGPLLNLSFTSLHCATVFLLRSLILRLQLIFLHTLYHLDGHTHVCNATHHSTFLTAYGFAPSRSTSPACGDIHRAFYPHIAVPGSFAPAAGVSIHSDDTTCPRCLPRATPTYTFPARLFGLTVTFCPLPQRALTLAFRARCRAGTWLFTASRHAAACLLVDDLMWAPPRLRYLPLILRVWNGGCRSSLSPVAVLTLTALPHTAPCHFSSLHHLVLPLTLCGSG